MKKKKKRKLHIGGKVRVKRWEVLDALPGKHVDHLGNANDLSQFDDNTFVAIYASHIAEHLDFNTELVKAFIEWNRVLTPGGKLFISVPDLDVLCKLFIDRNKFDMQGRANIMRMIFGGHCDEYDYHLVGLNQEFLLYFLSDAGFINFKRTQSFGLFEDASNMVIGGELISVNIIAEKQKT